MAVDVGSNALARIRNLYSVRVLALSERKQMVYDHSNTPVWKYKSKIFYIYIEFYIIIWYNKYIKGMVNKWIML